MSASRCRIGNAIVDEAQRAVVMHRDVVPAGHYLAVFLPGGLPSGCDVGFGSGEDHQRMSRAVDDGVMRVGARSGESATGTATDDHG